MHDKARIESAKNLRRVWPADAVAPVRQHHAARRDLARAGRRTQRQQHKVSGATEIDQFRAVLDRYVDHAPVPAQVVHPTQSRDAVELAPFGRPELRLEPGAEREARELKRWPGK